MPTVWLSMVTTWAFSRAMWMPPLVGYLSRPALIGTTLTVWPLLVTVIWWVAMLAVLTWASPMVKLDVWASMPQTRLPRSSRTRLVETLTLVPAAQNAAGRQWASLARVQCQAPATAGVVATVMCRSTLACWVLGIGWLKMTATGMPTPTTLPSPGEMVAVRCLSVSVALMVTVWKVW